MNQSTEKSGLGRVVLAVLVSFLLYLTSIGSLFFTLPLLLLDRRYPKRTTDTACVAALVLVLGRNILMMRDVLDQGLTWAFIAVTMFMPTSLILCAVVWVSKDRTRSIFERIMYAFSPSIVLFLVFEIVLVLAPGLLETLMGAYGATVTGILGPILGLDGESMDFLVLVVLFALVSLTPSIVLANSLLLTFIYEAATHPEDEAFECRIRNFRVPEWFLYLFLGLWTGVLLCCFITVPMWIVVPVVAFAICTILVYFLQGFAIVDHRLWRRGGRMTSFRLAGWLLLILILVQVLNAILVFGLALLGVLENWINLRKPEEFSDEDHS